MDKPTCGVVVKKKKGDQAEVLCSEPAADLTSIVNPDDQSQVMAVVLTCTKHSQDLNNGKMLMFASDDGEHIAVKYVEDKQNVS